MKQYWVELLRAMSVFVCAASCIMAATCVCAQEKAAKAIDTPSQVTSVIPRGHPHTKNHPAASINVRICTVSGKLANRYCPTSMVRVGQFTKGQEPTEVCTVHHKPARLEIQYVTIKRCPVGGETYPAQALFCTKPAHKAHGAFPRLVTVRALKK